MSVSCPRPRRGLPAVVEAVPRSVMCSVPHEKTSRCIVPREMIRCYPESRQPREVRYA
jgi:hypothetical protein